MKSYKLNLIYEDYSSEWVNVECESSAVAMMLARGWLVSTSCGIRAVVFEGDTVIACYC